MTAGFELFPKNHCSDYQSLTNKHCSPWFVQLRAPARDNLNDLIFWRVNTLRREATRLCQLNHEEPALFLSA